MATLSGQDFNQIMKYPIQDKDWFMKLCVQGAALFFLSMFFIGLPFLLGWQIMMMRKAINNDPTLPGWEDWGQYWTLGWRAIGAGLIYASPIILVTLFILVPAVFTLVIVGEEFGEELAIVGVVPMMLAALVIMVYSLLLYFVQPAYMGAIAAGATLKQTLQFKDFVLPFVKANFVPILIAWAIAYLAGMIASLGMLLLFIGYFVTYPYAVAVMAYTYGVIYRNSPVKFQPKKTIEDVAASMGV